MVARGGIRARAALIESESGAPHTIGGWRLLLNRYRSAGAAATNFGFEPEAFPSSGTAPTLSSRNNVEFVFL